jgi:uncharacterized membrane protein YjdF
MTRAHIGHGLLIGAFLVAIAAFLLKLAYTAWFPGTLLTLGLLASGLAYAQRAWRIRPPLWVLGSLFLAVQVDLLGNHFHMYGRSFGPVQYDEFAHMMGSALTVPTFIWLFGEIMRRQGHELSRGWIATLAVSLSFSVAGIYEIIELWDERYFGGRRIWSPHDCPNDLQWDLSGKILGAVITVLIGRASERHMRARAPEVSARSPRQEPHAPKEREYAKDRA